MEHTSHADAVEIVGTEYVREGESIKVTCFFTDPNIVTLDFYKDGQSVLGIDDAEVTISYEEHWMRADMVIHRSTITDAGEYTCISNSSDDKREGEVIKVHVTGKL